MSKRPVLVNTKKADGIYLDYLRAVTSNGKVILTICMSVCMCEYVHVSKSMRGCLPAFLSPRNGGGGGSFLSQAFDLEL